MQYMITLILGIKMGAILTLVLAMIAVAFFTLMERKVLGYIHVRKGPNKPGPAGLLVPFADAVKLFQKEMSYPLLSNKTLFNAVCVVVMLVPMLLWVGFPLAASHSAHKILVIYILAVASVGVYGTLGAGWSSNSKYAMLGAIRAVAQTISYEVSMTIIVLGAVMFMFLDLSQDKQMVVMTWMVTVFLMFAVSVLAEANRSPFDFAEGESELVSGFNTEYSSVLFVMVFLAEYMSIIFMSALCGMLFMASEFYELVVMSLLIGFFYIWSRGTLPRFRYDQLMYLAWKGFLPMSLVLLCLVTVLFSETSLWKPTSNDAKILFTGIYGCVSAAVAALLVALSFITFKTVVDKEKASPFECGFDPSGVTRLPFCMKFFMVSVIFLVFDIEVALILPMLFSGLTVLSFLFILVAGAFYEWSYGGLDWLV